MPDIEDAYQRYFPIIRSRCLRLLDDPAEAEDAAQEVFLRLVRHGRHAGPPEKALHWLYRVATRLAIDRLRARRRRSALLDDLRQRPDAAWRGPLDARRLLHAVVHSAPRRALEMAALSRIDGLTHEQIARVHRCSARTVRRELGRFDAAVAHIADGQEVAP